MMSTSTLLFCLVLISRIFRTQGLTLRLNGREVILHNGVVNINDLPVGGSGRYGTLECLSHVPYRGRAEAAYWMYTDDTLQDHMVDDIHCYKRDICENPDIGWQSSQGIYSNGSRYFVVVRLIRRFENATLGLFTCHYEGNSNSPVSVSIDNIARDITISENLTLTINSDLNGANPQFILTCISTGGPATTVTWTRDSDPVVGNRTTVLNDSTIAQYTHTLTVTGRLGGLYTCTVANDKPSEDSATYSVKAASAPTNLTAIQEGPTSIQVSWNPPTPLGDTTGYRIYYSGGSSGSEDVSDGSTDNYLLTGLKNGDNYIISIVGTSQHFFSPTVFLNVTVVVQPNVTVINASVSSISLAWSDSAVDSYVVIWISDECPDGVLSGSTSVSSTSYTIQDLRGGTWYTVTVSPTIAAGSVSSNPVTIYMVEYKPSAAPTSVGVYAVTSSNITVQWGAVDCIHHNGNITGYSIQYRAEGSQSTQIVQVSGGSVTEVTISSLMPSTTYSIEVAAVNSGGTGVYSHPVTAQTTAADHSQSDEDITPTITSNEDITPTITGGVIVLVVLIIAGTSIVVVVLVLRYRRNNLTEKQIKGPKSDSEVDIPVSTNVVYELTKCTGPDSEVDVPTSTNAAYKVIKLSESHTPDQPTAQQTTNCYSSSPSAGVYELV